jgi:Protein of unknown function (DUF2975)
MLTLNRLITPLKVLLALAFVFLVVLQFLSLPGDIADDVRRAPEAAHIFWPLLVAEEIWVLCLQAVIVCTWRLLTMIRADRIFSEAAFAWVNGIVWAFAAGWLVLAGLAAYLTAVIYFTPELRDPGTPVALFGVVLLGAVFVLLVLVLRALLRQATTLRTDMEAVI